MIYIPHYIYIQCETQDGGTHGHDVAPASWCPLRSIKGQVLLQRMIVQSAVPHLPLQTEVQR